MYVKYLSCEKCGKHHPKSEAKYYCSCGGVVRVVYDHSGLKKAVTWKKLRDRPFNHYRYKEFFPNTKKIVSLDEGGTSLVESGNKNRLFKLEFENPTGSFKDRGSTCEISHAIDMGAKRVVCASTGNMGASLKDVSENLKNLNFPSLSKLKNMYEVLSESGSPDYMWSIQLKGKYKEMLLNLIK